MKRCMKALALVAVMAFCAGQLSAEEPDYRFDLSPMVGGHIFEGNQNLDDGYTLGLALGYAINNRCTLEGGFTWISAETETGDVDVDGQRYSLDGLYHFMPEEALRPFVLIGAGALRLDPDVGDSETDFMAEYGAGIKYAVMDNLDLRAELRHVMPFDDFYNNLAWQLGISWRFGKREKAMAEEEPMAAMDSDGDGVPDDVDTCPNTPAGQAVDALGCPVILDSDGDGVPDDMDVCADTPAGQPVDELGCPVILDADGDGVEDSMDRCPDTPQGAVVDNRGCWVIQGLTFDTGETRIKSDFLPLLNEVVAVLMTNPEVRVSIEGYTDSQGSDTANQRISEGRAKAVQEYFVSKGVAEGRMEYQGFGEENPVADNETEEGRKQNRRVELRPL
ncbi:OmpA family protein [Desulfoluna spongiiphila]|uniref:OmpA-OmpF porin, OOP family n=1 Tax=Desulfoluna spongiiphila TaxID=419481 RepID=A0A1G5GDV2_9BACT|nr:OmpA family protein [Desulfoluna spongiiphila]SCY49755.1 OmpA-OmpF porin, OOP family [Desulfoluna spongiiphila]VVS93615.1 outer membrane protein beta-barrel [Desulfoluna spongiiphila]